MSSYSACQFQCHSISSVQSRGLPYPEDYPVRVSAYCLVNSIDNLFKTGLWHPLFKRIHNHLRVIVTHKSSYDKQQGLIQEFATSANTRNSEHTL